MRRFSLFTLALLLPIKLWALPPCMQSADPLCLLDAVDSERAQLPIVPPEYVKERTLLLGGLSSKAAEAGDLERAFLLLLRVDGIDAETHNHMYQSLAQQCLEAGDLELFDDISWELSDDEARTELLKMALRRLTGRRGIDSLEPQALATFFSRAEYQLRRQLEGEELSTWLRRLAHGLERIGEQLEAQRLNDELDEAEDVSMAERALTQGDFLTAMDAREWDDEPQRRAKQRLEALESWSSRWPQRDAASLALGPAGAGGLSPAFIDLGLRMHEARRLAEKDPVGAHHRMASIAEALRPLPDSPERDHWLKALVSNLMRIDPTAWNEAASWSTSIHDRLSRLEAVAGVMEEAISQGGVEVLPAITVYFDDPIISLLAEYQQGEQLRKDDREAEASEFYRRAMQMGMTLQEDLSIDGRSLKLMLVMDVMGRARRMEDMPLAREAGRWLEANIARNDAEPTIMTMNLLDEYRRMGAEGDSQRLWLKLKGELHTLDERQRRTVLDHLFGEAVNERNWLEAESLVNLAGNEKLREAMLFRLSEAQLVADDEAFREIAMGRLLEVAETQEERRYAVFRILSRKGGTLAMERLLEQAWLDEQQRAMLRERMLREYIEQADSRALRRLLETMDDDEVIHELIPAIVETAEERLFVADLLWSELMRRIDHTDFESLSILTHLMHRNPSLRARYDTDYKALVSAAPMGVRLRLRTIPLQSGPQPELPLEEWNEAWRQLLREGEQLVPGKRLLLWLTVARAQLVIIR